MCPTESPPPTESVATSAKLGWIKVQLKDLSKKIGDGITKEEAINILKTFQKATFSSKNGGTPQNSAQAIIALQAFLKLSNYDTGSIDGMYGPNTKKALIAFQKKVFPEKKNEWDGIPGPKTIQKIIDSYKADAAKTTAKATKTATKATDATPAKTATTVEAEGKKTKTITLTLNNTKTKIENVPDDKKIIDLLQKSKDTIDKIAFDKDGTLSVLKTNGGSPSQQIALLDAFGIPHDDLTEENLVWFRYKEKEGGITTLGLSETDAETATEILEQYPHLKRLVLSGLTSKQILWKKIPAGVKGVMTNNEWVPRPTKTITLNGKTINNVPNDKIELLQKSADAIDKIAFDKDGTLSVLKTNAENLSQQIALLKAFGIPHDGLTKNNFIWFRYEKEKGEITTLVLSETDGAKATTILKNYPHLKGLGLNHLTNADALDLSENGELVELGLNHLTSAKGLDLLKNGDLKILGLSDLTNADALNLLKNGKLVNLYLNSLTNNQVPWKRIPANVTKVDTQEGEMTRPSP